MDQTAYFIKTIVSEPFDQNAYVLWKDGSDDALVIDPGFDWRSLAEFLHKQKRRPVAFFNTHGHADHIAGNDAMLRLFPGTPLIISRTEAHLLTDPRANLSALFHVPLTSPPADRLIDEGEVLDLAGFQFDIRVIGGHSPGAAVLVSRGCNPPFAIGGDVLFQGSIGRTDFPGGSLKELTDGIHTKLFTLPDETIVYPGHGQPTTIGVEKRDNPFVGLG